MSLLYFLQILITCKLWLSFPAMSWLYGSWIQALLQVLRAWKGMWIHHLIEYMLHSNILKPRADISTWKFKIIFNFQVLLSTLGFSILYFQASLAINFYIFLYHCDSSVPYVNKSIILLFIWTVFFIFILISVAMFQMPGFWSCGRNGETRAVHDLSWYGI